MTSDMESESSREQAGSANQRSGWLRVGMVAAASALAGGLAAAWFYRKTLERLRQAEAHTPEPVPVADDPDFDI